VKLDPNLSEFNRGFAVAVRDVFSDDITAQQSEAGKLYFRGPNPADQTLCTHAAVYLDGEVLAALNFATPLQREVMTRHLIDNLATQVRAQYKPNELGQFALRFVGTLEMLVG
jgi:hypothetical protein